jgi:hypothetical protein
MYPTYVQPRVPPPPEREPPPLVAPPAVRAPTHIQDPYWTKEARAQRARDEYELAQARELDARAQAQAQEQAREYYERIMAGERLHATAEARFAHIKGQIEQLRAMRRAEAPLMMSRYSQSELEGILQSEQWLFLQWEQEKRAETERASAAAAAASAAAAAKLEAEYAALTPLIRPPPDYSNLSHLAYRPPAGAGRENTISAHRATKKNLIKLISFESCEGNAGDSPVFLKYLLKEQKFCIFLINSLKNFFDRAAAMNPKIESLNMEEGGRSLSDLIDAFIKDEDTQSAVINNIKTTIEKLNNKIKSIEKERGSDYLDSVKQTATAGSYGSILGLDINPMWCAKCNYSIFTKYLSILLFPFYFNTILSQSGGEIESRHTPNTVRSFFNDPPPPKVPKLTRDEYELAQARAPYVNSQGMATMVVDRDASLAAADAKRQAVADLDKLGDEASARRDWKVAQWHYEKAQAMAAGRFGKKQISNKLKQMSTIELKTRLKSVGIRVTKDIRGKRKELTRNELEYRANFFKKLQLKARSVGVKLMYKNNKKIYIYKSKIKLENEIKRQLERIKKAKEVRKPKPKAKKNKFG